MVGQGTVMDTPTCSVCDGILLQPAEEGRCVFCAAMGPSTASQFPGAATIEPLTPVTLHRALNLLLVEVVKCCRN